MTSEQRRTITRNRELLACTECRRRKLKCDRHKPCNTCFKRGEGGSCTYERFASGKENERERRIQAEARLQRLERLVVQQCTQNEKASLRYGGAISHSAADVHGNREVSGVELGASTHNEPIFNGSTHWSAMLEDIEELRSAILPSEATNIDDDAPEPQYISGAGLILGSTIALPLQQTLDQYLPPRQEADRLIAAYFRNTGVAAPFIHSSSFRRDYQQFWREPLEAPVLWTSMLFSIFHVTKNILIVGSGSVRTDERYNIASAHCLTIGEYFRPKRFAVESLLLFVQANCWTSLGMSADTGLIFGLLIRLATTMGYHRDPNIFPLSAFEKEMRRRTWSLCMQLDLLISFQLGLPSNIQYPTWDTPPPTNLQDSDFDENTKELPPARPDSESTHILFYIAKYRLITIFEKILRHNMSTGTKNYTTVNELDTEIRNIYSTFPDSLRARPMTDSVIDPPSLVVTRICVFFLYQKCLCVLHRPYVSRGQVYSIQICYDAASNIVRHFNDSYKEFSPGGQLETERWFMSNITWHDYLFGVIALCVALCMNSQHIVAHHTQSQESLILLRGALEVCMEQSTRNKDSGKVQKIVTAILRHFENFENQQTGETIRESSIPIDSSVSSLTQSPFAGDQTITHNVLPSNSFQNIPLGQTNSNWATSESIAGSMDDPSWAYLEQFLNLSDDDVMLGT